MIEGKPSGPDRIALAVRAHLRDHRITVTELARLTHIHRSRLSSWMSGNRDIRVSELVRVLQALDLLDAVVGSIAARWPVGGW